jgi:anionic cell wall polymer biosynthesis LytR-Cps2A-Psr (LCP) family protein
MLVKIRPYSKKILLTLFFIGLFLLSATASYLFLSVSKVFVKKEEPGVGQTQESLMPSLSSDPLAPYNVLLLGYGGAGHEGGALSDTIIVISVYPRQKQAFFISVPRDVWVEIPVRSDAKENYKINAAFAIGSDDTNYPLKEPQYKGEAGGGELAKDVVGSVVGMPIKYFISISFDGFKEAIDILGGVEVDVPQAFDDHFYPVKGLENLSCGKTEAEIAELTATLSGFELEKQFECRYEHLHFDAGKQQMGGETVLKFVRSRHSAQHGGDFARSERQLAVLLGLRDKILSFGVLEDVVPFVNQFSDTVRTDIDEEAIKGIVESHPKFSEFTVYAIYLTEENVFNSSRTADGQFILVPKEGMGEWGAVHSFIKEQIGQN